MKKTKRIVIQFILCSGLLINYGCVQCDIRYDLQNDVVINDEISGISCLINKATNKSERDELNLSLIRCGSYGNNDCRDKRILPNSVVSLPYFEKTMDTLTFFEKKESMYIYGHDNLKEVWKKNEEITINISYKVDSLGSIYDKNVLLTLYKDESCGFKVH